MKSLGMEAGMSIHLASGDLEHLERAGHFGSYIFGC
jgi:hypothetical protein